MLGKSEIVTTPERSRLMASVRQSGTSAELAVRKIVRDCGVDYQTKAKDLPGTPDLVSREEMWAIFVHGCFWHAHEGCKLWKIPKSNRAFWRKKFSDNRRRDKTNIESLEKIGYSVLVVWECELGNKNKLEGKIRRFLAQRKLNRGNKRETTNNRVEGQKIAAQADGAREEFGYSKSGKFVVRTVRLPTSRETLTKIQIKNANTNSEAQSAFDYAFLRKCDPPTQSHHSPIVRVVDLFCSCGGLSLGAAEACRAVGKQFLSVAAVDWDKIALEVYKRNFRCRKTYPRDITDLLDGNIGSKPTDNELFFLNKVKDVDILLAGPPCQGYSDLNNYTRRNDSRNALYERVARLAEIAKPEHILIENVPAVIHGREGAVQKSIDVMRELGYEVDSGVVDLTAIGVPQKRRRHVVIASASKTLSVRDVVEKYHVEQERPVGWAIGDLADEPRNGIFTVPSRHTEENMRRIAYLHENDAYDLPNRLRPKCHRNGGHSYKSMYGRLRWDEPAQTITGGFGSPGQGRFIHPTRPRTLTPHEAARLQFFPDFFDFSNVEKRTSLVKMIGNAAPMKLSYVFCLEMLA